MKRYIITLAAALFAAHVAHAELMVYAVAITNTGPTAQTYEYTEVHPFTLSTATSQIRGSVTVNVLDMTPLPGDGALLETAPGEPIYRAYIDGLEVASLLQDPYSLNAPALGVGVDNDEFGWNNHGAGVVTDMAIKLKFKLSPGDSAMVTSTFEVIPEPASLALIGLSISGIVFVRRRFIA